MTDPGRLVRLYEVDAELDRSEPVVVYGDDNVDPTSTWLTLKAIGFEDVRLYDGGFGEWANVEGDRGRYPVETATNVVIERRREASAAMTTAATSPVRDDRVGQAERRPPPADRVLAVPCEGDDLLALFALDTGERLGEVPVGSHPVHATTCRGRTVVATMGDRAVTAVDASGEVTQIETGVLGPSHFAAANGELYVSCSAGDALAVIDSERLTLVDRVAVGAEPHEVAVAPDGDRLYPEPPRGRRRRRRHRAPRADRRDRRRPGRPGAGRRARRTGTGDTRSTSAARGLSPSRPVTIRVLSPSKSRSTPRPRSAPTRTTSSRPVTGCSSPAAATVSSTSSTGS